MAVLCVHLNPETLPIKAPCRTHVCTDLVVVIKRVVNSTHCPSNGHTRWCTYTSVLYTHVYTRCVFSGEVNQEISNSNRFTQFEVCLMQGSDDQPAGR